MGAGGFGITLWTPGLKELQQHWDWDLGVVRKVALLKTSSVSRAGLALCRSFGKASVPLCCLLARELLIAL